MQHDTASAGARRSYSGVCDGKNACERAFGK
jgi:hypothetical protein